MTVKADVAATGGKLGLVETEISSGDSPPLHTHRDEDEAFYVLEGTVDFVCGDERFRAETGALAYLPRGVPHTWRGVSAARVLILVLPGGFEEFFAESHTGRFDELFRRHHIEVAGAPLEA